jgi:hypothetical protein
LATFPHLPEDIVARPGCSKTEVASIEDFLDQGLFNVLESRQGGSFQDPGSLIPHLKKGSKGKSITLRGVFSFYPGIPR